MAQPLLGYHASHEQFSPSELLRFVQAAEQVGFQGVLSSDHFFPWSERQGQSGFAWSWLGASMSVTKLPHGIVTCPMGWRYSPAIIAQASATLGEMFPGRFWMALGSGQALNEHIASERWPSKAERNERLKAAAHIIRDLHGGELVSSGEEALLRVDRARLYTLPRSTVPIYGAALSPESAAALASWTDGLITINQPCKPLMQVVDAFLHQRSSQPGNTKLLVQVHVSYARDASVALQYALEQWKVNCLPSAIAEELVLPAEFDSLYDVIPESAVRRSVFISSNTDEHAAYLQSFVDVGFSEIYIHNVGRNQLEFIEDFGKHVLPKIVASTPKFIC